MARHYDAPDDESADEEDPRYYTVTFSSNTGGTCPDDALDTALAQLSTGNVAVQVTSGDPAAGGLEYDDLHEAREHAQAIVDAAVGLIGLFAPHLPTAHARLALRRRLAGIELAQER